jgi:hypothetical protein
MQKALKKSEPEEDFLRLALQVFNAHWNARKKCSDSRKSATSLTAFALVDTFAAIP